MDFTIKTDTDTECVSLTIGGQEFRLTAAEASGMGSSLSSAADNVRAAEHKRTAAARLQTLTIATRPMTTCPAWERPLPDHDIRRAGSWLTDGFVAVREMALTPDTAAQLAERTVTPVSASVAATLATKAANNTHEITPIGWLTMQCSEGAERRSAVMVYDAASDTNLYFDALAWGWVAAATNPDRITGTRSKVVVFWRDNEAVALLQNIAAIDDDWRPVELEAA